MRLNLSSICLLFLINNYILICISDDNISPCNRVEEYEPGMGLYVTRIYNDNGGESHFSTFFLRLYNTSSSSSSTENKPPNPYGMTSLITSVIPIEYGIQFRYTPGDYNYTWHVAPTRQYIINLDSGVRICVSSGSCRYLPAGAVFFVEDTTGKGHISQSVYGEFRHSLVIPVSSSYKVPNYELDESIFIPYQDIEDNGNDNNDIDNMDLPTEPEGDFEFNFETMNQQKEL